tara:strand:+ start:3144 stop:3518 length:375 start_codon:yes stop_codon:yes gene_type:complete
MTKLLLDNTTMGFDDYYQEELDDINSAQKNILEYIESQTEKIENIETNLYKIDYNTQDGIDNLTVASNYNLSYKGVLIGGLLGCVFLSPFGFLLGLKTGTVISLSGMVVGSVASYKLQAIDTQH